MTIIIGVCVGVLFMVIGIFLFRNRKNVTKNLLFGYEGYKIAYDKKYSHAPLYKKILGFFFEKPDNYYYSENQAKYTPIFIAPFIILLGFAIILLSLHIIQ